MNKIDALRHHKGAKRLCRVPLMPKAQIKSIAEEFCWQWIENVATQTESRRQSNNDIIPSASREWQSATVLSSGVWSDGSARNLVLNVYAHLGEWIEKNLRVAFEKDFNATRDAEPHTSESFLRSFPANTWRETYLIEATIIVRTWNAN